MIAQSLLASEGVETLMPEFNVLMAELDPSTMERGWRLMGRSDDVFRGAGGPSLGAPMALRQRSWN